MTAPERAGVLRAVADILEQEADRLARLETTDNGKLLRETAGQMAAIPPGFATSPASPRRREGETIPTAKANFLAYTVHEPVGVVGAIVPWNSPLLLLVWKLAPALAAGCTLVVKPSDHTPVTTIELARCLERAGLPPGVLNVVTGWGPEAGKALAEHPGVDLVAFTARPASARRSHAPPPAIWPAPRSNSAASPPSRVRGRPLPAVRDGVIAGIFAATGQTCIAGSRLLVHRAIKDELCRRSPTAPARSCWAIRSTRRARWARWRTRNSSRRSAGTSTAPSARAPGRHGRRRRRQGRAVPGAHDHRRVTPDMALANDEVFGPVLAVDVFDDEDEAIEKANATRFGLAAGVWTIDVRRAHRVASRLRAGTVWVNSYRVVAPQVPFGGVGDSGWGRESGLEAMHSFTETKAVWIELEGADPRPVPHGLTPLSPPETLPAGQGKCGRSCLRPALRRH